jgi:hypothetical protein
MTARSLGGALIGAAYLLAASAAGAGEDTVSTLLEQQTQAFSDASLHGDTAAINGFVDDAVLFSDGSGGVQGNPDAGDATSALLKRRTEALFAARRRGDLAAMREVLDDAALITNEDGVVMGPRDLHSDGVSSAVTVREWVLHHSGDVAVASYIGDRVVDEGGLPFADRFRALDTWVRRGTSWKLLASQAIPLVSDPPTLPSHADELDDCVGTYSGPLGVVTIARAGNTITSSLGGAKPVTLAAESPDVFFAPGVPRARRIFARDAAGHVTAYVSRTAGGDVVFTKDADTGAPSSAPISAPVGTSSTLTPTDVVVHHTADAGVVSFVDVRVTHVPSGPVLTARFRSTETWIKRGAAWKMLASQTLNLWPDPPAVILASDTLNDDVGSYTLGPGKTVTIARSADGLAWSGGGRHDAPLRAETRDIFFTPGAWRTRIVFQRDASGRVTACVIRRDGRDLVLSRVG